MKTLKRLLLLAPLALAGGCIDNKPVVEMFGVCAPPDADACSFDAECDGFYLGDVVVDIDSAQRLILFLEVHNQLLPNDDPGTGRVNTNDAFVQEVFVTFRGLDLDATSHRLQQVVPANGTTVIAAFPVTEEAVAQLGTLGIVGVVDFIAQVRLRGILGDGSDFETAQYEIPVRVCNGCLPGVGPCADPAQFLVGCPADPGAQAPTTVACVDAI